MVMDPIVVPDQIDHVAHAKRRTAAAKDSFLREVMDPTLPKNLNGS